MYRVPPDLDLEPILGDFSTQIRVGLYDIQFELGGFSFIITSRLELRREQSLIAAWEPGGWPEPGFKELFNNPARKFDLPTDREIVIYYDSGAELHLFDDSDKYECIHISGNGLGLLVI